MSTFTIICPSCGDDDVEVEVNIVRRGTPGSIGGPPWSSISAEGCEWEIAGEVKCIVCSTVIAPEIIYALESLEKEVQQRDAERDTEHDYPED